MDKSEWRVYRIEDKDDLMSALQLYELRKGAKPRYARVSEKAPEDLLFMLRELLPEVEIETAKIMMRDVWLTHERKSEEDQPEQAPQLRLFA